MTIYSIYASQYDLAKPANTSVGIKIAKMNDDFRRSRISSESLRDTSESHSKTPVGGVQCQTNGVENDEEATLKSDKKFHLFNHPSMLG